MKYILIALPLLAVISAGCGPKVLISENRMMHVPPREATCALELIQVDVTSMTFNQEWDTLGYISFGDTGIQDPYAKENRELLRPRACAMGGTAVTVAINSAGTSAIGRKASTIAYMVLRPKTMSNAAPEPL